MTSYLFYLHTWYGGSWYATGWDTRRIIAPWAQGKLSAVSVNYLLDRWTTGMGWLLHADARLAVETGPMITELLHRNKTESRANGGGDSGCEDLGVLLFW